MKIKMKLVKPARKSGGDKYEGAIPTTGDTLTIYFPQSISRPKGSEPIKELEITVEG